MSKKERDSYEYELNHYRTYWATIETAKKKAETAEKKAETAEKNAEAAEKKAKAEIARNLKKMGLDTAQIVKATGLSLEEIKQLD